MMFSVDVKFDDSYYKKLGLHKKAGYKDVLDIAVDHTLHDAENTMRREAPIDTGNLRRSISKHKPNKCQGQIHSSLKNPAYWVYVQYGTSKMSANPFVTRTAKKVGPNLSKYVHEELKNQGITD